MIPVLIFSVLALVAVPTQALAADWLIGIRGPAEPIDLVTPPTPLILPDKSCRCTAVAEARLVGRNGHVVVVEAGRWPGNTTNHAFLRVRYTVDDSQIVDGKNVLVRVWRTIPAGATRKGDRVQVTLDTETPSVRLNYRPTDRLTFLNTPLIVPPMAWTAPKTLQVQARNAQRLPMRMALSVKGVHPAWRFFKTLGSPFNFLAGSNTRSVTVAGP